MRADRASSAFIQPVFIDSIISSNMPAACDESPICSIAGFTIMAGSCVYESFLSIALPMIVAASCIVTSRGPNSSRVCLPENWRCASSSAATAEMSRVAIMAMGKSLRSVPASIPIVLISPTYCSRFSMK